MKLRGVNLGGWLLLEKWITPSLFAGLAAEDEQSFWTEAATTKYQRLQQHRQTFITKRDFEWLAQNQINSVRIPIGYWALQNDEPFVNCAEQLDQAFRWASEFNLKVVVDLHGAPGSQNGLNHSGKIGSIEWNKSANIERTLDIIGQLAKRYSHWQPLWGIELLNEPGWEVPLNLLREFYKKGYQKVREHCDESVAVIISDAFRPLEWNDFMNGPSYKNVVLDMHLYQCFTPEDKALDIQGHLDKTYNQWSGVISQINRPIIIGEWSLGLDPQTFSGMDKQQKKTAIKAYASAQLEVFGRTTGWFFWTYKTENMPGWNYKYCVEAGTLP